MTKEERELAREAKRAWAKAYRKTHPERIRETNERYWLRRALREQEAQKGDQDGTNGA